MTLEQAPQWAKEARILTATCKDMDRLGEMAGVYGANVVFLYVVPENEVSNGWCPRGTYEEMDAFVREAHRHGLKVISYYDFSLASEDYCAGREDWVQRNPDGEPQHVLAAHIGKERYIFCPHSPWGDYVVEVARKRADLGVDGMFLDNPGFYTARLGSETCYCRYCQAAFREQYGEDLFSIEEVQRLAWKGRSLGELMEKVYRVLRSSKQEVVVTCNVCGDREPRTVRTLGSYENVVFREVWEIESVNWKRLCSRLQEDLRISGGKPEWVVLPLGIGEPFEETAPGCKLAIAAKVAGGARPFIWAQEVSVDPTQTGLGVASIYTVPEVSETLRTYYLFLKRWEDYLTEVQIVPEERIRVEDGGGDVLVFVYRKGAFFVVHLVNFVGIGGAKTKAPVPQHEMKVTLRIPSGYRPKGMRVLSPDFTEEIEGDVVFSGEGDRVSFTVPELAVWDVVVVE